MEDRIQINGVWYVREDNDTDNSLEDYMHKSVVTYQCMAYEDFDWVFEAHADSDEYSDELDSIEIENKRTAKKEMWDSLAFIRNFNPSTYEFRSDDDILTKEGAKLLYYFIHEVMRKGWL